MINGHRKFITTAEGKIVVEHDICCICNLRTNTICRNCLKPLCDSHDYRECGLIIDTYGYRIKNR